MPAKKVPARKLIVQVQAADGVTWLPVGGINSASFNPSENEQKTETTTFDSGGNYEERKMQKGASVALEGLLLKDPVTGVQDAGQLRCEVLHDGLDESSVGSIRFRHLMDTLWKVWAEATFTVGEQGGGNNDMVKWSCAITRSGASTTAAAP